MSDNLSTSQINPLILSSYESLDGDLLERLRAYQEDTWLKRAIEGIRAKYPDTPEDELVGYGHLLEGQHPSARNTSEKEALMHDPETEASMADLPSIRLPLTVLMENDKGSEELTVQPIVPILIKIEGEYEGQQVLDQLKGEFGPHCLYIGLSPLGYWVRGLILVGEELLPQKEWEESWNSITRDLLKMGIINDHDTRYEPSAFFISSGSEAHIPDSFEEVVPYKNSLTFYHFLQDLSDLLLDHVDPARIPELPDFRKPVEENSFFSKNALIEGYLKVVEERRIVLAEDSEEWFNIAASLIYFSIPDLRYGLDLYKRLIRTQSYYSDLVYLAFFEALYSVRSQLCPFVYSKHILERLEESTGLTPEQVMVGREDAKVPIKKG